MTAIEKEKRYTSEEYFQLSGLPECCELIDGIIYDMSPSPNVLHQDISIGLGSTIWNYIRVCKGKCRVFTAPFDVRLTVYDTVQPDVFVVCDTGKLDGKRCNGAPDWVTEILSPSSERRDAVEKLALYMQSGVREYWIVDPETEKVFVYLFEKTNAIGIYTFEDDIPVGIYKDAENPLIIRVKDIL